MEVDLFSIDGKRVYGKHWENAYRGKGRNWHLTWESAVARAEEMRKKEIESYKRKIKQLEKLDFNKPNTQEKY